MATGPLATARAFAAAARLDDGRVLIAGGVGARQAPEESGTTASSRALASVERFDPGQNQGRGAFVAAAPLLSPRRAGAAVALANGALLIAGGSGDNDNRLASVELYSPDATPAARAVMNLSTPRGSPATALLPDGRVLIAGGDQRAGRAVSSAELFRPRGLGRSGQVASTGSLHTARAFASAVALGDGSILIAGGRAGATLDSIERYEPRSGAFAEIGRLRVQRTGAAALPLANGEVLVAGGLDASGAPVASGELLSLRDASSADPTGAGSSRPSLRVAATPPLAIARAFPGALLLSDGRALLAGAAAPTAPRSPRPSCSSPALPAAPPSSRPPPLSRSPAPSRWIARLPDGRALIADGTSQSGVPLASAEIFDPLGNGGRGAFAPTGSMAQARVRAMITPLPNGKLLIAGGLGQAALASAELFDPLADNGRGAFQPTGGLAVARQRPAACSSPTGPRW